MSGQVRYVDMAVHRWGDEIKIKTLKAMVRQSGLAEDLFKR